MLLLKYQPMSPHYSPDFVARRVMYLEMRRKMKNLLAAVFYILREQIFHFTQQIHVDRPSQQKGGEYCGLGVASNFKIYRIYQ